MEKTVSIKIGGCSILAILFIALKLIGVINWSWVWVLAPLWIPIGIGLGLLVIILVITGFALIINEIRG